MNMRNIERFNLSRSQWETLIDEWIFKDLYRELMKDRLLNGLTYDQLADKYDISFRNVQNIVYKCTDKLIKHI